MRAHLMRSTMAIALLALPGIVNGSQNTGGSWLDAPKLTSWHTAGSTIPSAPKVDAVNPTCKEQARPPQTPEDEQVRERGWDLVGAFHGGWQIVVVRGTAGYDGMCRPMQYQDFVFVNGRFAGTLAPAPMNSRTDGALGEVTLQGPSRLMAEYVRYEKSDALCCPSRVTQVTFEVTADPPAVHARSASTLTPGQSPSSAPAGLAGTSWQLVKFEGGDDTVRRPDDPSKYTIEFGADGRLAARIDCNRGRGTWKSDGSSLELGPLALTRAMCPPGSLHDHIVRQWSHVRSYVIRDGHLFLSLAADGGILEFEPMAASK
jgi:heat shock protein HslJ